MSLRRLPILLACAFLCLGGCDMRREPAINLSLPPGPAGTPAGADWTPLLADMAKAVGARVEPLHGSSEDAAVEALRFKQVDFGWFEPAAALEALGRANGEVFGRVVRPGAPDGDRALLIVRKGSGLTLARVLACDQSLAFGLGEAGSLTGELAPATFLFGPRRIDPASCFRSVRVANAEANLYGVAMGAVDAAFSDVSALARFGERTTGGGRALDRVEAVWSSPALPGQVLVWRKDLDPAVKSRIARFLFAYGVGEGREAERQRAILRALGVEAFVPADDGALKVLRVMEATRRLDRARARRDPAAIARAQAELDALSR